MVSIGILIMLLINISTLYVCPMFGCYEISIMNLFRANLICNVCTDISYNIQKFQIHVYFAIGGFVVKRMNSVITEFIKEKMN